MSFLSKDTLSSGTCGPKDVVWQVGCALMSLACGKSPFRRGSLRETLEAIGQCNADLSGAGHLEDTCRTILTEMKGV